MDFHGFWMDVGVILVMLSGLMSDSMILMKFPLWRDEAAEDT